MPFCGETSAGMAKSGGGLDDFNVFSGVGFLPTTVSANSYLIRNLRVTRTPSFSLILYPKNTLPELVLITDPLAVTTYQPEGGGGLLPRKRLTGMWCWTGSHFHNWID